MAIIVKSFTFSSGATILSSEHNTNFDTLYTLVNGNIDNANIKAAAGIAYSKLTLTGAIVLADLATAILSGSDTTLVTGTAGTNGQYATWNSDGDIVGSNLPTTGNNKIEVFTSDDTWTCPSGITLVYITACGGGGGGGGGLGSGDTGGKIGGGGGSSGAACVRHPYTVTPTTGYTVDIGAGGAGGAQNTSGSSGASTSFGDLTLTGGGGGVAGDEGATGGTISSHLKTGTFSEGEDGTNGGISSGSGGDGGGGLLGTGGTGDTDNSTGESGLGYGSGGAGGAAYDTGGNTCSGKTGGVGAAGFVLIEYTI